MNSTPGRPSSAGALIGLVRLKHRWSICGECFRGSSTRTFLRGGIGASILATLPIRRPNQDLLNCIPDSLTPNHCLVTSREVPSSVLFLRMSWHSRANAEGLRIIDVQGFEGLPSGSHRDP